MPAARATEDLSIPLTSQLPAAPNIPIGGHLIERGHPSLTITRKSGKIVTIPVAPGTVA